MTTPQPDTRQALKVCHDLANVLHVLSGPVAGALPEELERLDRATSLGTQLVKELRAILLRAIPPNEELKRIQLSERFARWPEERVELAATYGVDLHLTHDVSPDCVVWSRTDVAGQVLRNLISNAARAGATRVHVHYQEYPNDVEITLSDDGHGIDKHDLPGLGLNGADANQAHGVAIVRELVFRAGGTVRWDSRKGVGTWVTIMVQKVAASQQPVPASIPCAPGESLA